MSLEQIKEQFDREGVEIQDILKQSKTLMMRSGSFITLKQGVEACIRNYSRYMEMPEEGIRLEFIAARKVFCYDGRSTSTTMDSTITVYSEELKKQVILKICPWYLLQRRLHTAR